MRRQPHISRPSCAQPAHLCLSLCLCFLWWAPSRDRRLIFPLASHSLANGAQIVTNGPQRKADKLVDDSEWQAASRLARLSLFFSFTLSLSLDCHPTSKAQQLAASSSPPVLLATLLDCATNWLALGRKLTMFVCAPIAQPHCLGAPFVRAAFLSSSAAQLTSGRRARGELQLQLHELHCDCVSLRHTVSLEAALSLSLAGGPQI